MKLDCYKNSWKIYKDNFPKLFIFIFAIVLLLIASFSSYLVASGYLFAIISILLFVFGVVPLFYCLQFVVAEASAGKIVEYNDLYKPYKAFFVSINRGAYSLIKNLLLTLLIYLFCCYFSLLAYNIFFSSNLNEVLQEYPTIADFDFTEAENFTNALFNMPYYIYFQVAFMILPFIFFFYQIKNRLVVPYLNLTIPLPSLLSNKLIKSVIKENKKMFKECCSFGNFIFLIAFILGYLIFGLVGVLFKDSLPNINLIFILAFSGGILLAMIFIPPLLINYCFVADSVHQKYLKLVTEEILRINSSIGDDPETKELVNKMLDSLNTKINEEDDKEN